MLEQYATVSPWKKIVRWLMAIGRRFSFAARVKDLAQTVTEDGLASTTAPTVEPIIGDDVLIEVGGKNTLPAFNEALRGAKPGQEMTFEVSYPQDFGEQKLAGQTVGYDVTVKGIKKKTFPDKDAEFAKILGGYESWEEFETKLREHTEGRKKDALESQAKDQMLTEMIGRFQFPVPESFVQQQVDAGWTAVCARWPQQGMSTEDMRKLDFGRLRMAQRDQAVNEVKASMILDRVADAEGVTIADEDLDRELMMLAIQSREPLETLRERLSKTVG